MFGWLIRYLEDWSAWIRDELERRERIVNVEDVVQENWDLEPPVKGVADAGDVWFDVDEDDEWWEWWWVPFEDENEIDEGMFEVEQEQGGFGVGNNFHFDNMQDNYLNNL